MTSRILIVDDNGMNVDILRRLLRREYELESTADGASCLKIMPSFQPDLVLLDIMMPGLNGYEVCRRIKESAIGELTQVVLVSGKASTAERLEGYEAGADDYVVKPFDHDELLSKVRVHCRLREAQVKLSRAKQELELYNSHLEQLVDERTKEVVAVQDMTVFALAELAESRDTETGAHLIRIRTYAQILAEELQASGPYSSQVNEQFLADLYRASPLHDIGKVGIPDAILRKPGELSEQEFTCMKQHVILGADTLEKAVQLSDSGQFLQMAADVARYHHERWNGAGYCAGLQGEEIPLAARIVSLADVFDALTSRRVYKPAHSPEFAGDVIRRESGTHFDPVLVDAFGRAYDRCRKVLEQHNQTERLTATEHQSSAGGQTCVTITS